MHLSIATNYRRISFKAGCILFCGLWVFVPGTVTSQPVRLPTDDVRFSPEDLEFFEKQVRPILVNRCGECHGGSKGAHKGGLTLNSRAALLKGGDTGPAIVPGKPAESLLVDAINYGPQYQMPPKNRLPAGEVDILTRWVHRGAPWPPDSQAGSSTSSSGFDLGQRLKSHWAWTPPARAAVPSLSSPKYLENRQWLQQPSDAFVLEKLVESGLKPVRPADRSSLVRRAAAVLHGLVPTPAITESFTLDNHPDAWDRLIDQLMAHPAAGERGARQWMDLVRYAETCGHEFDYPIRNAFLYRDYLIRAFNQDLPFDRFAIEHIAGDLLADPRIHPTDEYNESILGTTFWFLGEAIHAPVDVLGDSANRLDNQIDVFSKSFLGLTVACARCHDHKFDAISQKDYYALMGFLRSSRRQEAFLDPHGYIRKAANRLEAIKQPANDTFRSAIPQSQRPGESAKPSEMARYLIAAGELFAKSEEPSAEAISQTAKTHGLDEEHLLRWIEAGKGDDVFDAGHALHAWAALGRPGIDATQALAELRKKHQETSVALAELDQKYPRLAKFAEGALSDWYIAGEAFRPTTTRVGEWDSLSGGARALVPGVLHSGVLGRKLRGVLRSPTFTIEHPNIYYRIAGEKAEVRLIIDGYTMIEFHNLLFGGIKFDVKTDGRFGWVRQSGDLRKYLGHRAYIELIDQGDGYVAIDEVRFSHENGSPPRFNSIAAEVMTDAIDSLSALAESYDRRWQRLLANWHAGRATIEEVEWLNWMLSKQLVRALDPDGLSRELDKHNKQLEEIERSVPDPILVPAMVDGSGENERVYVRGNHRILGEEVPRRMLEAVAHSSRVPFSGQASRNSGPVHSLAKSTGSGRLELARQVASAENPLTARVAVNRVWQQVMGRGIVPTADNFGVLGERPSHPELLDWLAERFVEDGWSLKRATRSMLLSATFQLSTEIDPQNSELDPTNRWLHRAHLRRLESESIRDSMLVVSGRFDNRMYGSGVPIHITPFMQGRGKPAASGPVDGAGRRSLYIEVRRNFLSPMMLAFDTPIPFTSMGNRNESNVPAQALFLLNDPFVVEQAALWAETLQASDSSFAAKVDEAYLRAFARRASLAEHGAAGEFFATQGSEYGMSSEQAVRDIRVWTDFCHVLFNVKEFIFVP